MNGQLDKYTNEFIKRVEATGKKEIKAHGYLIDEGILSWDNFFVPIKHVAIVSQYVDKKVSIGSAHDNCKAKTFLCENKTCQWRYIYNR